MAQDRARSLERSIPPLQVSEDAPVGQLTELRLDLPLGVQRSGSFMEYIDERYPQLESRWTASISGEKLDEVISDFPVGLTEQRRIDPKAFPPRANASNWNDIPDEMLHPPSREMKPQSKAEAIQRRKSRKRKATKRQKTMAGSHHPENTDDIPAAQVPSIPEKFRLHRPAKMKPDPDLQKFKLKQSIGTSISTQAHITDHNIEELATSAPDASGGSVQDENNHQWSDNSDIEELELDDIMKPSRATFEHSLRLEVEENTPYLSTKTTEGITGDHFSAETEHKNTHVDEAAPSAFTQLNPDSNDAFAEYNYLKARAAAGEPTILPKDMLEKLRAKVRADDERRREKDPRYQHELMMVKVNAAQAQRETEIPHEALYPESTRGEKCNLDMENWDLLDDFETKAQSDEDNQSKIGIALRSEGEIEGNVMAPSEPEKAAHSASEGSTGNSGTTHGQTFKAGSVFTSKKATGDPRKAGWTLADILDDDEQRARH